MVDVIHTSIDVVAPGKLAVRALETTWETPSYTVQICRFYLLPRVGKKVKLKLTIPLHIKSVPRFN